MKLLVFGQSGQVASELARRLPGDVTARFLGRDAADLADPHQCAQAVGDCHADVVINAAAWTGVDQAESNEAAALIVNGESPGAMARAAAARGLPFLHLSSDYVFDGAGRDAFAPDHPPAPLNAYGRTKLAGERAVLAAGGNTLVVRTSWVFSAYGSNFVRTMLRLGRERTSIDVVADQIGGPTPAAALADALIMAARAMKAGAVGGVHHFSGAPDTSWADFARAIMQQAGLPCAVRDIASSQYPAPALRPGNSRLDCSSFSSAFGIARPDWRKALREISTSREM